MNAVTSLVEGKQMVRGALFMERDIPLKASLAEAWGWKASLPWYI